MKRPLERVIVTISLMALAFMAGSVLSTPSPEPDHRSAIASMVRVGPQVEQALIAKAAIGKADEGFFDSFALPFEAVLEAQPNRAQIRLTAPYRVTIGAAAVQLTTSGNVNAGVCVKALSPGQTVYLGVASNVTTATGWPMTHNESLCLEVRNANELYGIASAAAQEVAVLPFSRF